MKHQTRRFLKYLKNYRICKQRMKNKRKNKMAANMIFLIHTDSCDNEELSENVIDKNMKKNSDYLKKKKNNKLNMKTSKNNDVEKEKNRLSNEIQLKKRKGSNVKEQTCLDTEKKRKSSNSKDSEDSMNNLTDYANASCNGQAEVVNASNTTVQSVEFNKDFSISNDQKIEKFSKFKKETSNDTKKENGNSCISKSLVIPQNIQKSKQLYTKRQENDKEPVIRKKKKYCKQKIEITGIKKNELTETQTCLNTNGEHKVYLKKDENETLYLNQIKQEETEKPKINCALEKSLILDELYDEQPKKKSNKNDSEKKKKFSSNEVLLSKDENVILEVKKEIENSEEREEGNITEPARNVKNHGKCNEVDKTEVCSNQNKEYNECINTLDESEIYIDCEKQNNELWDIYKVTDENEGENKEETDRKDESEYNTPMSLHHITEYIAHNMHFKLNSEINYQNVPRESETSEQIYYSESENSNSKFNIYLLKRENEKEGLKNDLFENIGEHETCTTNHEYLVRKIKQETIENEKAQSEEMASIEMESEEMTSEHMLSIEVTSEMMTNEDMVSVEMASEGIISEDKVGSEIDSKQEKKTDVLEEEEDHVKRIEENTCENKSKDSVKKKDLDNEEKDVQNKCNEKCEGIVESKEMTEQEEEEKRQGEEITHQEKTNIEENLEETKKTEAKEENVENEQTETHEDDSYKTIAETVRKEMKGKEKMNLEDEEQIEFEFIQSEEKIKEQIKNDQLSENDIIKELGKSFVVKNEHMGNIKEDVGFSERNWKIESISKRTCKICHMVFARKAAVTRHMRCVHSDNKPYKCNECEKCFNRPDHLKNHKKVHEEKKETVKLYPCIVCDVVFNTAAEIKKHKIEHAECPYENCSFSAKTYSQLKYHIKKHKENYYYSCPVCSSKFLMFKEFHKHKQLCFKVKYVCTICNKVYLNLNAYSRHMRDTHFGKKKTYNCESENCNKTFQSGFALREHIINVHHRVKRFFCSECNLSFGYRSSFTRHNVNIHNSVIRRSKDKESSPELTEETQ